MPDPWTEEELELDCLDAAGEVRGVIHNPDRRRQLISFHGLRWGRITPTDLDLSVDFQGRQFVFAEIKMIGQRVGTGQGLNLSRIVDCLELAGRQAVLFVAEHDVTDPAVDVDAAACVVRCRYTRGREVPYESRVTLREAIDTWLGVTREAAG